MLQSPVPKLGVACSCNTKGLNVVARARNAWLANNTMRGRSRRISLKYWRRHLGRVIKPYQGGPVLTLYSVDLAQPLGVTADWAQGTLHPKNATVSRPQNIMRSGLNCRR